MSDHPPANWGPGHLNHPRLTPKVKRTPEAQADIAAARAPSCAHAIRQPDCPGCVADLAHAQDEAQARASERAAALRKDIEMGRPVPPDRDWNEVCRCGSPSLPHTMSWHQRPHVTGDAAASDLTAALSDAALADTPAVREMGGPATVASIEAMHRAARSSLGAFDVTGDGKEAAIRREVERALPGAVLLTGPEADRYRALQSAARKAQASAAAARTDGAALLQLFQALCAGLAPGKGG